MSNASILEKCSEEQLQNALLIKKKNQETIKRIHDELVAALSFFGFALQIPDDLDTCAFPETPIKVETEKPQENKKIWLESCLGIQLEFKLISKRETKPDEAQGAEKNFLKKVYEHCKRGVFEGVVISAQSGNIVIRPQGDFYKSFLVRMFPSKHYHLLVQRLTQDEVARLSSLKTAESFWTELRVKIQGDAELKALLVHMNFTMFSSVKADWFEDRTIRIGPFVGPTAVFPKKVVDQAQRQSKAEQAQRQSMSDQPSGQAVSTHAIGSALTKPLFKPESAEVVKAEQLVESLIVPAPGRRVAGLKFETPGEFRCMLRILQHNFQTHDFVQFLVTLRQSLPDEDLYRDLTDEARQYKLSLAVQEVAGKHRFGSGSCVDDACHQLVLCFAQFRNYLAVLHDEGFHKIFKKFRLLPVAAPQRPDAGMVSDQALFASRVVSILDLNVTELDSASPAMDKAEFLDMCMFQFMPRFRTTCAVGSAARFDLVTFRFHFKAYLKLCSDPYVRSFGTSSLVFRFLCHLIETVPGELVKMLQAFPAPAEGPEPVALARELVSAFLGERSFGSDGVWKPPAALGRRVVVFLDAAARPSSRQRKARPSEDEA